MLPDCDTRVSGHGLHCGGGAVGHISGATYSDKKHPTSHKEAWRVR